MAEQADAHVVDWSLFRRSAFWCRHCGCSSRRISVESRDWVCLNGCPSSDAPAVEGGDE